MGDKSCLILLLTLRYLWIGLGSDGTRSCLLFLRLLKASACQMASFAAGPVGKCNILRVTHKSIPTDSDLLRLVGACESLDLCRFKDMLDWYGLW